MTDTSFDPDPNLDAIAAEQGKTALIAELQQALFTGPGALSALQGAEAIGRASDIAAGLQDRRADIPGRIADPAERSALARQLDTVLAGANQGIGRHLAAQHAALDRSARGERFGVLRTEARLDPHYDDKIDALARAAAGTALDGATASAAWSSVHADAIDSRFDLGNPAGALTLWDRTRDSLDDRTRAALEPTIQSTRTRLAADELAKSSLESFGDVELSGDDVPPGGDEVEGGSADDTPSLASPMERAKTEIENRDDQPPEVRRLAIAQLDEQADAERARRSSETSDIADKAARLATLAATAPHRYNRGSFQALAGRAAAIGDTSSALKYGHLAADEDYITAFARLSPTAQQRQLADLPPEPKENREEVSAALCDHLERYSLPPVESLVTPRDHEGSSPYMPGISETDSPVYMLAVTMGACFDGDFDRAQHLTDAFVGEGLDPRRFGTAPIRIMAELHQLLHTDHARIPSLMHEWEERKIDALKLRKYWTSTPFPCDAATGT